MMKNRLPTDRFQGLSEENLPHVPSFILLRLKQEEI